MQEKKGRNRRHQEFIHAVSHCIFLGHLLHARHFSRYWAYNTFHVLRQFNACNDHVKYYYYPHFTEEEA